MDKYKESENAYKSQKCLVKENKSNKSQTARMEKMHRIQTKKCKNNKLNLSAIRIPYSLLPQKVDQLHNYSLHLQNQSYQH